MNILRAQRMHSRIRFPNAPMKGIPGFLATRRLAMKDRQSQREQLDLGRQVMKPLERWHDHREEAEAGSHFQL